MSKMISRWHMIAILLKVSLSGQMLAVADDDVQHPCQLINTMSTSVVDGYIEDAPTGINFFYAVAYKKTSISLSWFVPSQRILETGNITFWIYKNSEQRQFRNFTTINLNGSYTGTDVNLRDSNVQLHFKYGNVTSIHYCCAIVDCIVIPPPSVNVLRMHQPENTEKVTVELRGNLAATWGIRKCFAEYWETAGTDDAHNKTKVECASLTSCSLEHLPPHTTFEVRMGCKYPSYAIHPKRILWSQPLTFTTQDIAPGNVVDVQYNNVGYGITRSVLITWQPVLETQRNGLILFYTVTLTGLEPTCFQHREVHNTTNLNYTLNGLDYACRYLVVVTPSNGAGEGRPQRRTLEEYRETPSRPTLSASSVTARRVTLVWHPPERPYGLVTYRLFLKAGDTLLRSTEQLTVSPNPTTGQYSYPLEDLKPHTMYTLTLRVENHARHCDIDLTVTTRQEAPSASPATLTATGRSGHPTELRVKWMPVPRNERNGDISRYTLSWWLMEISDEECHGDQKGTKYICCSEPADRETWFMASAVGQHSSNVSEFHHNITDSGILSYDITGLSSNSTYCVAITASTVIGEGPSLTTSGKTVKDFIQVEEADIKNITSGSVSLGWRLSIPVDSAGVSTYLMVDGLVVDSTNKSSHLLESLKPYTLYNISIKACWIEYLENGCGPAKYVAVETKATIPTAPLKLTLNYLGENHVNLSWDMPACPNGPISYYRVVYYETNSGDDSKIEQNTTKQNFPDIQVHCNDFSMKEYVFEVSAVLYTLPELEGPPAKKSASFCSNRSAMGIIITVVIVPCCIITICVLLVWWFFLYPKKKIDIKIAKSIYHPKMISSTGKVPEREVFDTLKAKPEVIECETYMIMKPSRNLKVNESNLSQDYLQMSKTYITDAT